jgi:hypothetical protein
MTLAKSEQSEARSVSGIIPHSGDEIRTASGNGQNRCRKLNIKNSNKFVLESFILESISRLGGNYKKIN